MAVLATRPEQAARHNERLVDSSSYKESQAGGRSLPPGWISCDSDIPDEHQWVLAYGPRLGIADAEYSNGRFDDWHRFYGFCGPGAPAGFGEKDRVTHWMPLPEPPR